MIKNGSWFHWRPFLVGLLAMLAGVALLGLGMIGYYRYLGNRPTGYQAVFLTNGQVYFGKVVRRCDQEIRLTGIYYLQNDKQGVEAVNGGQDMKLIKLGNELHGPQDMMYINREHVLFIEDLKADSRVVKAMQQYK